MKFSIHSGALAEHISAAISSLPSKPTIAIMGGVLIEAQIGAVTLSSFNYDRATIRSAAADVMDADTAVVSGRLLAAVGGNLPKKGQSEVSVEGNHMTITTGRTVFRLPLLITEDYPRLPVMTSADCIGSVDAEAFTDAVKVLGSFASTDILTPDLEHLAGLNIDCGEHSLTLCATDRYIIGRRRIDWDGTATANITVPAADILAVIKAIGAHSTGTVEVLWNESMLGLKTPSTTVMSRVLAGEFPPTVNRILHTDGYFAAATVPTADLTSMLKRAMSVADDQWAQVAISVEHDTLTVETVESATGNIADGVPAIHYGGPRRLTLSSRRLHNALAAIDDPKVTLAFQESGYLLAIHPGDIDEDLTQPQADTVAMLMGIRSKR